MPPSLEARLTELSADLKEVIHTQIRHNALLEEHMRRTEANEANLDLLRSEFAPVKAHLAVWGAAGKLIASLGTLVGIAGALYKFLG